MKYETKYGDEDLFIGITVYVIIGLIFGYCTSLLMGWFGFIILFGITLSIGIFNDFQKIPKDNLASIIGYNEKPLFNRSSGYLWNMFGLRKVNYIYKSINVTSDEEIKNAITKDDKKVLCSFQATTKIVDPLLLEETAGDNFEDYLIQYRMATYKNFLKSVNLSDIETEQNDNLKDYQSKIKEHHSQAGVLLVRDIEILKIIPEISTERENTKKQEFKEKSLDVVRKEFMYRVNERYLTLLVRYSNDLTEDDIIEQAENSIKDLEKLTKDRILRKAVKIAEKEVPLEKRNNLYETAKKDQELLEGKFSKKVFEGLTGKSTIIKPE